MRIIDLDPVTLVLHGHKLYSLGCTEVTLSRPFLFTWQGIDPPVLFVLREDNQWQTVDDDKFEPEVFAHANASSAAILASRFPGITFHERLPDGTIRTIVDCRSPTQRKAAEPPAPFPVPGPPEVEEEPVDDYLLEIPVVERPELPHEQDYDEDDRPDLGLKESPDDMEF